MLVVSQDLLHVPYTKMAKSSSRLLAVLARSPRAGEGTLPMINWEYEYTKPGLNCFLWVRA